MNKTKNQSTSKFSSAEEIIKMVNKIGHNETDLNDIDVNLPQRLNSAFEVREKINKAMPKIMSAINKNRPSKIDTSSFPKDFIDKNGKKVNLSVDEIPESPQKMPAEISKDIIAAGIKDIKWTNLKDLNPDMLDDIRKLSKAIFASFNIQDGADVLTISSFKDDSLLNTTLEVNSVLGYLDKNLIDPYMGVIEQDFGEVIKDYKTDAKVYQSKEMVYLVVSEPKGFGIEGNYIYAFKRKQELKLKNEKRNTIKNKI